MLYIKMSQKSSPVCIYGFLTEDDRKDWLLEHGFVNSYDVWYHPFTKHVAGTFAAEDGVVPEACPAYKTCDKRLPPRMRVQHGTK